MRPDRDVRYSIRVQFIDKDHQFQTVSTGMLSQRFGLGSKTSKSEVNTDPFSNPTSAIMVKS